MIRQPRKIIGINRNDPLSKDLLVATAFQSGVPLDVAGHGIGTYVNGAVIIPNEKGLVHRNPGEASTHGIAFPQDPRMLTLTAATVMYLAKADNQATSYATINPASHAATTGNNCWWQVWGSDDDFGTRIRANNGTTTYTDEFTDGLGDEVGSTPGNQWNLLGFTWGNDVVYTRINKLKSGGTATSGAMNGSTDASSVLRLGRGSTGSCFLGEYALLLKWGRELTDDEWNLFVDDPWRLFKKRIFKRADILLAEGNDQRLVVF